MTFNAELPHRYAHLLYRLDTHPAAGKHLLLLGAYTKLSQQ
jgi:hypothetical protein